MDEDEYKDTYFSVNTLVCPFEKALLSRQVDCSQADRIFIAERQAVGCRDQSAQARCSAVLASLRQNASFALKMTAVGGALPHAREIKVQVGGLQGLQGCCGDGTASVTDIDGLLAQALARYGDIDQLPYAEVVKSIAAYEGRRRRGR